MILMWMANERLKDFAEHQQSMVNESVERVSAHVTMILQMRVRMLDLFVDRYALTLNHLVDNPDDEAGLQALTDSVKKT